MEVRKPGYALNSWNSRSELFRQCQLAITNTPRQAATAHPLQIRIHQTHSREPDKSASRTLLFWVYANRL